MRERNVKANANQMGGHRSGRHGDGHGAHGCGSKIPSTPAPGATSSKPCGTFNLAVNPWVGYEADAAVVAYVAKTKLGCTVNKKNLNEEVAWQGFGHR